MEFETIRTEERDGVFIITFNRLEARNAINNLMTKELSDALDYWDKNDELRACVLTNNGHVFCAGSDLKELAEDAWEMPEGRENGASLRARSATSISRSSQPYAAKH